MRHHYMRDGEGFLLVFSIISELSFNLIQPLHEQLLHCKDGEVYPVVLVGNKCDVAAQREVAEADARALAFELSVPYIETSAKTGANVTDVFVAIVRLMRDDPHFKAKAASAVKRSRCSLL
eukprot:TRINITY_DN4701_c0_g1_i1.p1 TRINITY_DN4701_c0_g1~~TRINITY_DN4701_c0_g1_i1.p1  ORF type:complete len:121 (+),score=42.52 TRINITY_DN4701_c0_g1_i1:187-549(+)